MKPLNILCVTSYFKGVEFIRSCRDEGNHVYLVTSRKHENEPWPRECLADIYYMEEDVQKKWNLQDLSMGLAFKFRSIQFDKFVSLDDFDVEKTAWLRELFRMPGMGETTARYFRDKLAMRMKAEEHGIRNPAFTAVFNDNAINHYTEETPPPWVVKPRGEASATGIRKVHSGEELWTVLHALGDKRHQYLIEKFNSGDVYHVDSLTFNGKVLFTKVSQYLEPPFDVAHGGGIFRSMTLSTGHEDDIALKKINENLLHSFGMRYSASHSEYIKSRETGEFIFLETSCRVGGAHISDMIEAASGINLWKEWARIESSVVRNLNYLLPQVKTNENAGIIVSLSRFQHPDTSRFTEPEICWRMKKDWHIGLIVRSGNSQRVKELLDQYQDRIQTEFHASMPHD